MAHGLSCLWSLFQIALLPDCDYNCYLAQLFSQFLLVGLQLLLLLQTSTASLYNGQQRNPVVRQAAGVSTCHSTCGHVTTTDKHLHVASLHKSVMRCDAQND